MNNVCVAQMQAKGGKRKISREKLRKTGVQEWEVRGHSVNPFMCLVFALADRNAQGTVSDRLRPKLIKVKNEIKSNIVLSNMPRRAKPHQQQQRNNSSSSSSVSTYSMIRLQITCLPVSRPRVAIVCALLHLLMFLLFSRFKHFWSEISGCDLLFKYTEFERTASVRVVIGVARYSLRFIMLHFAQTLCIHAQNCVCDSNSIRVVCSTIFSRSIRLARFPFLFLFSSRFLVLHCQLQWTIWLDKVYDLTERCERAGTKNNETSAYK